jgi:cytoskeleton protein RodZ
MPTLGQTLKAAREKQGLTTSALAALTRIKVQHIEAVEQEQFSRIAAPMYARGFIKLYAEQVGLDPAPLIQEYNERFHPVEKVSLVPDPAVPAPAASPGPDWTQVLRGAPWRRLALITASVVLALFVLSGLSRLFMRGGRSAARPLPAQERPASLSIIREPPEPYLQRGALVTRTDSP